jgi:hypothetical protein
MLYKFKSKAAGDLIMLEPNGRRMLEIVGKDARAQGHHHGRTDAGGHCALEAAVNQEEAEAGGDGQSGGRPTDDAGLCRSLTAISTAPAGGAVPGHAAPL